MHTKTIDIRNSMVPAWEYVDEKSDNELIEPLYGNGCEVAYVSDDLAAAYPKGGKRSEVVGIMQIISPDPKDPPLTKEQELRVYEDFKREYKTGDRPVSMTKHTKHDGTSHYHLLVSDRDEAGRRLDVNKNYQRNEKLSRIWEVEFGHKVQKGKHNKAVINHLSIDGNADIAAQLEAAEIDQGELPKQAFSKGLQGKAKKLGIDLSELHSALVSSTKNSKQNTVELTDSLRENLASVGLELAAGKKEGHLIIQTNKGDFLGALDRIAKIDKSQMKRIREIFESGVNQKHISEHNTEHTREQQHEHNSEKDKYNRERLAAKQEADELSVKEDSGLRREEQRIRVVSEASAEQHQSTEHISSRDNGLAGSTASRGTDVRRRRNGGGLGNHQGYSPSVRAAISEGRRSREHFIKLRSIAAKIFKRPAILRALLRINKLNEQHQKKVVGASRYADIVEHIKSTPPLTQAEINKAYQRRLQQAAEQSHDGSFRMR